MYEIGRGGVRRARVGRRAITNVVPVLGTEDDPKLPSDSLDAVLLVDAYHEFAYPYEMMQGSAARCDRADGSF